MDFCGDDSELNPMVLEIAKLAADGLSDAQIARKIGKSCGTVYVYRRIYGIEPGFNRAVKTEKPAKKRQKQPKPKFKPLNRLRM